jgi:hypothetical protein
MPTSASSQADSIRDLVTGYSTVVAAIVVGISWLWVKLPRSRGYWKFAAHFLLLPIYALSGAYVSLILTTGPVATVLALASIVLTPLVLSAVLAIGLVVSERQSTFSEQLGNVRDESWDYQGA